MNKTVQSVKNSLKFKAVVKSNALTVKLGTRKFTLPVECRALNGEEYLFLSFPACSELFRVKGKELLPMKADEEASEAYTALNPTKKRSRRRAAGAELPAALQSALKGIPAGYRLGYDASGSPRLVRTRIRKPKGK